MINTHIANSKLKRKIILYIVLSIGSIWTVVIYCRETKVYPAVEINKLILVWVPFFGDSYFHFGNGSSHAFINAGCKYTDCELTSDPHRVSVEQYDAVIFHGFEYYDKVFGKPSRRSSRQIYVYMSVESAIRSPIPEHLSNFYNYTMTYRLDSDIPWPYFHIIDKKTGDIVAPALETHWADPNITVTPEITSLIAKKERDVAWFVSNCRSKSGRERVARELKEAGLQVDIYGKCGDLQCPREEWHACVHQLRKYRFYLAFENSICVDYVTEKVVSALEGGAVPVVLSGANLTRFLPPGSYVVAEQDGASLASTLRRLSSPDEYAKFHVWRERYRVIRRSPGYGWPSGKHPFCDLCARLHNESASNIKDVSKWWHSDSKGMPTCKLVS